MKNALGLFVLVLIGCSLLVEPTSDVRCDGPGTCPIGFMCDPDGICREMCVPPGIPEECNGRDDDCDGMFDEGLDLIVETCNAQDDDCDRRVDEGHDADGNGTIEASETFDKDEDGFNTCGTDSCSDPDVPCEINTDEIDCNDLDFGIKPRADERCNGTDTDCDGNAFPLGEPDATCRAPRDDLCGGGQICEPDIGCIPLDCNSGRSCTACGVRQVCEVGRCVDVDCDSALCEGMNQFCDSSSPECQDRRANGAECNRDVECLSGFCDPGGTLGLPSSLAGICFEPCCRDSQCPSGEFCYGPGTGARSCIRPRPGLEGATGRTAVGSGGAGASCSTGAECRSGRCDGTSCFSACSQPSDCPGSCGVTDEGLGCRTGGDLGDACSGDGECSMHICGTTVCLSESCTTASSCPSVGGLRSFCDALAIDAGSGLQAVQACTYADPPSPLAPNAGHGESCDRNYCATTSECCLLGICVGPDVLATGCQSGTCLSGRCTTTCCDDAGCPGTDVCRPQSQSIEGGTFFPMFCVPPT